MTVTFADSIRALSKGARVLMIAAPATTLRRKMPRVIPKAVRDAVAELAGHHPPGDLGAVGATLGRGKSPRIVAGVLPDKVSRYNCAARAESIRKVVAAAPLDDKGKNAIVLILDDPAHALAAANAVGRALPRFSAKSSGSERRVEILMLSPDGTVIVADDVIRATVEASLMAGELVDTAPSDLTPEAFDEQATSLLTGITRVRLKHIVGERLVKEGLNGIYSVGKAASSAPRLVQATYTPRGKAGKHVALVGKGVTFDTGGLHIKGRGFMEGMKCDMGGAAAMLGAFHVLATTGCPHKVTLLLCMAENAIGPASYKPDDIITMHSGKTVEINNTDAEGRLLLADGVSYAARTLEANVVFDAATLTGAQLISTGLVHAAIVSNDAQLEQLVIEAGHASGDLAHPLPFAPELYQQEFASKVADMRNSVANRLNAQSACAAQFVYAHMQDAPRARSRKWCHVDLAGPAFAHDRGTGYGVALVSEAVRRLS